MKIAEGLYCYEWADYFENNCNSYFIGAPAGILIDPGLKSHVPELLRRLAADGIDGAEIRHIVNTHSHPDHFEGAAYFNGKGTSIGLHEEEISFLAGTGGDLYDLFGLPKPRVDIDLLLDEGPLYLREEELHIFHVPGHSPGSVALYWPIRRALFSGDVIFNQNVGRTDFPGGSGTLLKRSIVKLSGLEAEWLLPGHMDVISGAEDVKRNFDFVIKNIFPYI